MKKMLKAVGYATAGLKHASRQELNVKIELLCACLAMCAGFIFNLSATEWCIIILSIATVLSMEIMNTAIERLCDRLQVNYDVQIELIKDLAAAAVLLVSLAALASGAIIFIPKILLSIKM